MSRRTLAIVIAVPLTTLLMIAALVLPIPYVLYQPGTTVDVLSTAGGKERIQVTGHKTYDDNGELRMVTIYVTNPGDEISLGTALLGWVSRDDAVRPYDSVYDDDETAKENDQESALQMATSQDVAIAVALKALGYDVPSVPVVSPVEKGMPADGKLLPGDRLITIGGKKIKTWPDVVEAVTTSEAGKPLTFVIDRAGTRKTIEVSPRLVDGRVRVGISEAYDYKFPFDVTINIDDNIGGPSAGLMFSLSIYDTLTPGSLTGGHIIAGTGEIRPDGSVGPIGGIQQKIAAARDAKAELFLVPAANCDEALGAPKDDVRLARVETMEQAKDTVKAFAANPDADLPSCKEGE
jgi:PDZ domain-containing protein